MLRIRRHDLSPRVELLPMIDVIFLLLTFFIYAMVTMVQAEVLPVQLSSVGTSQQAEPGDIAAITIDRGGQLYFNREPIAEDELRRRLESLAEQPSPPTLFLATEASGGEGAEGEEQGGAPSVDRLPTMLRLVGMLQEIGLQDFQLVESAD